MELAMVMTVVTEMVLTPMEVEAVEGAVKLYIIVSGRHRGFFVAKIYVILIKCRNCLPKSL
ncbi:MAG: hypothetical protein UV73_C0008G0011 [Candidatus Gottesmanbacteria bacterium GW2011_GWA2_43_14]|uniref:Uncharacterized protein n=1 Tax=Candidatus Gottesmanbacteria bacterium GW2011_GWA2_43_14 TaxID=1618443 RepID=A0A0G1FR31_9BACT|nr:MAG: hypothetical protein UV73_C0008G0011 [Candidatus Gottesmanbacteria bacterium GW2011_GWA2_43_14]